MTLLELNNSLSKIKEGKSRESILNFSFDLLEWLGLEPNKDRSPQLVAHRTQKLREELVNTPITNQPQLYRITAENQNIRIRFAVLKRIRKDVLNLLVDNDPGNDSFQKTPDALKSVSRAPYYVHFVTTSAYDRLIVIFNNKEQKRIISFRNQLSNTQYYKIVNQWKQVSLKSKSEIESLLWKSLDITEVNKEFFKKIKETYDSLILLLNKDVSDEYKKQFAIKLIGRYIFCWFLKEKEIIPFELICSEKIESTVNYFKLILQKLFFDTLNRKVQDRNFVESGDAVFVKIPYLNGGLFDESEEDRLFADIEIDNWLISFVKVLESYDFTVDESSSSYQQVAVDPEMLGRVFENLLASQNPETEKAANERKSFGAFYTPREIVEYMVNESLKSFLSSKLNLSSDDIHPLFELNPKLPENLKKRKLEIENNLKKIKIIDPACGSGAFPITVLHKLVILRELTGDIHDSYSLKKEILSNNIYGIDIMPMAVEIARLRAWLSLIVEEDYKPDKPNINFGIDALPNLDFKFMQGNSLLETYEGIKLFEDKLLDENLQNRQKELLKSYTEKIKEVEQERVKGNKTLSETKKRMLEKEAEDYQKIIRKIKKNIQLESSRDFFVSDRQSGNISQNLKKLHDDYFRIWDKEKKKEIKEEIDSLEWNLIVTTLQENGKEDKIEEIEELRKKNIKPYFIYKLNFPDVWSENNGFDIIIGNPPYVRADNPSIAKQRLQIIESKQFETLWEKWDLMIPFIEKSLKLLNDNGINTFIVSNSICTSKYAEKLQDWIIKYHHVKSIDYFEDIAVFEAGVIPVILSLENLHNQNQTIKNFRKNIFENNTTITVDNLSLLNLKEKIFRKQFNTFFSPNIPIDYLGDICYMSKGMVTNSDENTAKGEFVKDDLISNTKDEIHCKGYIEGKDIKAYMIDKIRYIEYNTNRVPDQLSRPTFRKLYTGEKILRGRVTKGTYDNTGLLCNDSIIVLKRFIDLKDISERSISVSISKNNIPGKGSKSHSQVTIARKNLEDKSKHYDLKFLLGIINSTYAMAFLNNFRRHRLENYFYPDDFRKLPIAKISEKAQKPFIELVDKILKKKEKNEDTTREENEIDQLVYKLYDLTEEEIKIVEGNTRKD